MKKLLLAAFVLALAVPAMAQKAEQSSFDKMYNGLTLNGAIQPKAQKPLSSWEKKEREIIKKAEMAKAQKEAAAKEANIYAEAEAAIKDIPNHVKHHYDSLIASGKTKEAVSDLSSASVLNKDMKAVKYFVLRQFVIHHGTGILSPSLDAAQHLLRTEGGNTNDYVSRFARDIEIKCHNNDETPFKHLRNIKK